MSHLATEAETVSTASKNRTLYNSAASTTQDQEQTVLLKDLPAVRHFPDVSLVLWSVAVRKVVEMDVSDDLSRSLLAEPTATPAAVQSVSCTMSADVATVLRDRLSVMFAPVTRRNERTTATSCIVTGRKI
jgi:hypothetical protein